MTYSKMLFVWILVFICSLFIASCGGGGNSGVGGNSGGGGNNGGGGGSPNQNSGGEPNKSLDGPILDVFEEIGLSHGHLENSSHLSIPGGYFQDEFIPSNLVNNFEELDVFEFVYRTPSGSDTVTEIFFVHRGDIADLSDEAAVFESGGRISVFGEFFTPTPSGNFVYTGFNILQNPKTTEFPNTEDYRNQFRIGEFQLTVDFARQTGQITGTTKYDIYKRTNPGSRSSISGNIILNNQTGAFRTPDNEYLTLTVFESSGSNTINAKIYGEFSNPPSEDDGTISDTATHGVRGVYFDNNPDNYNWVGALVGGRN